MYIPPTAASLPVMDTDLKALLMHFTPRASCSLETVLQYIFFKCVFFLFHPQYYGVISGVHHFKIPAKIHLATDVGAWRRCKKKRWRRAEDRNAIISKKMSERIRMREIDYAFISPQGPSNLIGIPGEMCNNHMKHRSVRY